MAASVTLHSVSRRIATTLVLLLGFCGPMGAFAQEAPAPVPVPTPAEVAEQAPTPVPDSADVPDVADADDLAPPPTDGQLENPQPVDGAAEPLPAEAPPVLQAIVIDAAPYGIDPVVGRHVTDQMRATAAALGYRVVSPEETVAAAQGLRMPYPPTPADVWRVTYFSQSQRGAFARVWAHGGSYVIEIAVASLDETGPFFARGNAGAADLHTVVDRLLRQALPPPETWQQGGAGGAATFAAAGQAPAETEEQRRERTRREEEQAARAEEDRRRTEEAMRYRWHLVLQTEAVIGTSQDGFYNHLVGGRIDFRVTRGILFGLYVGYANLQAKEGRANNLLFSLMVEDRIRVSSKSDISIPLRLSVGYLPYNGPVIRLSAGINIPLTSRIQLGFDLLAPTFWILPERTAVSLNIAAEIILRL